MERKTLVEHFKQEFGNKPVRLVEKLLNFRVLGGKECDER
jgi:hypothetical protein